MSDAVNEVKLCWSASGKKHVIFTSGFLKLCCRFHIFAPFRVCFNCTKPPQHKAAGLSNLQKCDICTMQTQLLLLVLLTGINLYFRVEITIACLLRRHIAAVLSTRSDPLFELAWPGFLLLCYLVCSRWAYTLQVRPKHAAAACRHQFTQTLKTLRSVDQQDDSSARLDEGLSTPWLWFPSLQRGCLYSCGHLSSPP